MLRPSYQNLIWFTVSSFFFFFVQLFMMVDFLAKSHHTFILISHIHIKLTKKCIKCTGGIFNQRFFSHFWFVTHSYYSFMFKAAITNLTWFVDSCKLTWQIYKKINNFEKYIRENWNLMNFLWFYEKTQKNLLKILKISL